MPSQLHESLLLLFHNQPELAPRLLREVLGVAVPAYSEARIGSAELTEAQPAEYRADLVVLLYRGKPVLGIVIEAQLERDDRKRYTWPHYATGLRARIGCEVCLLVVAGSDAVARWAALPIALGGGNTYTPLVLGPSGVPEVTDEDTARRDPELAVLSAMAHGEDLDTDKVLRIALAAISASMGLDEERSALYFDLVASSVSEAARKALQSMDPAKYEYQSEFARRYIALGEARGEARGEAKGKAEGRAEGSAELVLKLLGLRFGALPAAAVDRVRSASLAELDTFAERVLTARSLEEVIGPL